MVVEAPVFPSRAGLRVCGSPAAEKSAEFWRGVRGGWWEGACDSFTAREADGFSWGSSASTERSRERLELESSGLAILKPPKAFDKLISPFILFWRGRVNRNCPQ